MPVSYLKITRSCSGGVVHYYNQNNARILRGGPMMKLPSYFNTYFDVSTDDRKKLWTSFHFGHFDYLDKISRSAVYTLNLNWKARGMLSLSGNPLPSTPL